MTSATLEKPLARESLVTLTNIFRRRRAVAYLPRGRLAYRGSMQIGWTQPKTLRPSNFKIALIHLWCQPKTEAKNMNVL